MAKTKENAGLAGLCHITFHIGGRAVSCQLQASVQSIHRDWGGLRICRLRRVEGNKGLTTTLGLSAGCQRTGDLARPKGRETDESCRVEKKTLGHDALDMHPQESLSTLMARRGVSHRPPLETTFTWFVCLSKPGRVGFPSTDLLMLRPRLQLQGGQAAQPTEGGDRGIRYSAIRLLLAFESQTRARSLWAAGKLPAASPPLSSMIGVETKTALTIFPLPLLVHHPKRGQTLPSCTANQASRHGVNSRRFPSRCTYNNANSVLCK
ncbi:hypothetical protein LX36DRAFT_158097 [Colletotrichum falcatum]|nr:hypothetical protein LX36DRAFT_158097 [Colletotrichum falcatum]